MQSHRQVTYIGICQTLVVFLTVHPLVCNLEQKNQRFIPISEKGEGLSSLAVSPDRHLFAVAEKTERSVINVYDVHSFRCAVFKVCTLLCLPTDTTFIWLKESGGQFKPVKRVFPRSEASRLVLSLRVATKGPN